MNRQPPSSSISPPMVGAMIGAMVITMLTVDIFTRAAWPSNTSRTTAIASVVLPAAPIPASSRKPRSAPIEGASAQPMPPSAYSPSPPSITGRRPNRSDSGPTSNCAAPNPARNTDSVSAACSAVASRLARIRSSAGSPMSMDSGGSAARAPSRTVNAGDSGRIRMIFS